MVAEAITYATEAMVLKPVTMGGAQNDSFTNAFQGTGFLKTQNLC